MRWQRLVDVEWVSLDMKQDTFKIHVLEINFLRYGMR